MSGLGALLPDLPVRPPGPASRALAERLRAVESANVTFVSDRFPVFWKEARGANVRDADGNVYLDLTSAFGVSVAGHAHPRIVEAAMRQTTRLVHGMGDVHPPAVKVELMERLAALGPWSEARVVLASSGSEAVEIALKTALLATGRPGIATFDGGYHGLTLGALAATPRPFFREPFVERLYPGVGVVPWPAGGEAAPAAATRGSLDALEALLREGVHARPGDAAGRPGGPDTGASGAADGAVGDAEPAAGARVPVGAVIVEPVQGRGGVRIPPAGFLGDVSRLARRYGAVVIADEVFTGMGRCGAPLASGRVGLEPDVVCLGKALGGGFPLSACLAAREVMEAWPESTGEALHTSTFLGHPVACAAALAVLGLVEEGLAGQVERRGVALLEGLRAALQGAPGVREVRGLGGMLGVALEAGPGGRRAPGAEAALAALQRGVLVLPAGDDGSVVQLSPPATLTGEQARYGVDAVAGVIRERAGA